MPPSKQIAREIFRHILASIDIPLMMERKLAIDGTRLLLPSATIDFARASRVLLIGIGKAAHAMVAGLTSLLPPGLSFTGVVAAPTKPAAPAPGLDYFLAGHPTPNQDSWNAAVAILRLLQSCDEHSLVFFLLSGGGSALVELPLDPSMALEHVQALHRALVTCGAPIDAMNTVRRHLSAVKGGRLALAAGPAQKIVPGVTPRPNTVELAGSYWAVAGSRSLPQTGVLNHKAFSTNDLLYFQRYWGQTVCGATTASSFGGATAMGRACTAWFRPRACAWAKASSAASKSEKTLSAEQGNVAAPAETVIVMRG